MENKTPEYKNLEDPELISAILAQEGSDLFGILYARYAEKVKSKCFSLVRNKDVVEDLSQDIFIKTMENLPRFRKGSSFSTWLYSITYNHCIEFLRKNKRIKFEDWASQIDLPEEVEDQEIHELFELRHARLTLLMEMLKPEDKAILIMKYHEGMRLKTIMEILKIEGESAAKMKINRAKKRAVGLYQKFFDKIS